MQMFNRPYTKPVSSRKQPRIISSNALELLSNLTHAKTEDEAIREIIHVFSNVFQPLDIIYIALQGDAILSVRPHDTPSDVTQNVIRFGKELIKNSQAVEDLPGKIVLPIASHTETYGMVSLEFGDMPRPDHQSIDFGHRLASYAGVVTSNLRSRQKLEDYLISQNSTSVEGFTGLSSRRYFFEIAEAEFRRSQRYSRPLSAILVDVDNFKLLNDAFGSETGDQILKDLSRIFNKELRESDIRVRMSGEELLILLPETHMRYAHALAERLRRRIEEMSFEIGNQTIKITISVGVASLNKNIRTLEELVNCCDQALTQAKHCGKNQVSAWAAPLVEYGPTFPIPETDYRIGFY
jgi:diguanylate cyclase (GGDEF)-like protein